jgi:diguanylate cyclase (GGDEF)-like protein
VNPPRKIASLLLAGLVGACLAARAWADDPLAPPKALTVRAERLTSPPRMDGLLDDWADAPPSCEARIDRRDQLHPAFRQAWKGPQDASVSVHVGVYGDDLYLALAFTDDVIYHDPSRAWWHGDSLELFLDPDPAHGKPPAALFGPQCRQIFLMPANHEIPWGVVYQGRRQVFSAGDLHGVEFVRGPERPGGQDAEVRIPLDNFGIHDRHATRLGFALALNDTDDPANAPESYLSWNRGFDLYLYPRHFGTLEIPARPPPAPPPAEPGGSTRWPWFVLLGVAAAWLIAGRGARWLAHVGPRAKVVALGGVLLVALAVHVESVLSAEAETAAVRAHLEDLADRAARVARDAAPYLPPEQSPADRLHSLENLLRGLRVEARAGVREAALVPLHPGGAFRAGPVPAYAIPFEAGRRILAPEAVPARALRMDLDLGAELRRGDEAPVPLGHVVLRSADGAEQRPALVLNDPTASQPSVTVPLEGAHVWREILLEPDAGAPPATIRALRWQPAGGPADGPFGDPVLLSGTTLDGVPVLAHGSGPNQGVDVAPGARLDLTLPTLAGADRLWLLLSPQKAFPQLLGDSVLVRVAVHVPGAADPAPIELRNGEHLGAQRLLPGIRRPGGVRSREAFRWHDTMGFTHVQQELPVPLDPHRAATSVTIGNVGPGGTLRVVAATVVRSGRAPDDSSVRVVRDDAGGDWLVLAPGSPDFADTLRGGSGSVRVRRAVAGASLEFRAEPPAGVAAAERRDHLVMTVGLAVVLFLTVLLVVDAAERLRFLTWRLGVGVLVAALIPLAVTIALVERENTRRTEAEHAARVRTAAEQVSHRLDRALRRVQNAARRLARHLSTEIEPNQYGEIHRVARLYGAAVLETGLGGTVAISGAKLPVLHVPLDETDPRRALRSPRFLQGAGARPGLHVSPWDGLLLVGSARLGRTDDWVRVTIGVRVEGDFLDRALRERLADPDACAALLDDDGRLLVGAGRGAAAMRRALAPRVGELTAAGGAAVLPHVGAQPGQDLVVATRLGAAAPAPDRGVWLALGLSRAVIDRALAAQREPLLWLALLGLVLVVGVATIVARRVADPVRALVRVTDAVRTGRFDVEVPARGADEVGRLTVAFDQMRRDLKQRIEDLGYLRRAQDALASSLDFGRRSRMVLHLLRGRFGADRAYLLDARSPRGPVTVVAEDGASSRFAERPFTPARGGRLAGALGARRAVEIPAQPAEGETLVERRLLEARPAWLAVPLRTGRELQGLVLLGWKDAADRPSPEARSLLEPLAGASASSLNNARLYRLAALDDVTRLPGATAFEAALRADVEHAVAGGPEAVLLRIGLDHLEHVTLRRDVELARELLRACASALLSVVGERVLLGRLRGEELAVRLPGRRPERVREMAEALCARLGAVEVPPEEGGESVTTTVSVGIARCPADARSLEFLLDAAGRALTAAQREGGNRVEDAARLDSGAVEVPPFEEGAVFRNERMVRVVESARRAARSDASVLITGETGTGKEVIASLVHRRSARVNRPFVTVNCAAFPETLLESELFGHERGAFTGAERRREGRFELADGGTLFLDEVAEMSPSAQVKLLRVLQERQFTRLGGTRPINVDVRIIAATNKNLEKAVAEGAFREDLYYRLNVIRLDIPPLRERRQEIPPLVDLFLREARRRAGGGPKGLTSAAMDVLYRHPWPGNVRELKNVIERCAVLCETERIGPEDLRLDAGPGEGGSFLAPRSAPRDDLNERQRKLLDHLARHGRCTNRQYQELAGTSARTGLRDLQDLMDRGLLVREGKRRGAVYRLP